MRGLERPPRWAIALMVVLVIGNAALLVYLFAFRSLSGGGASEATTAPLPAAATTEPSSNDPPVTEVAQATPVVAVYGHGYTAGSQLGGLGSAGWPALVAQRLDVDLRRTAVSMAGYASEGVTGETFSELVASTPVPEADVVVVFGSRNDLGADPAVVEQGATETLASLRATAPEAQLVIIGPTWTNAEPPAELFALSAAVERAATAAEATFVDPLAQGWFSDASDGLIAPDGISPTDAGHAYLADQITPLVDAALSVDQ